jgi:hypothetical protein
LPQEAFNRPIGGDRGVNVPAEVDDRRQWDAGYIAVIEDLGAAAERLRGLLEDGIELCEAVVKEIRSGTPAADRQRAAFERGNRDRLDVHEATRDLDRALRRMRTEGIRILVDSGEASLAEVARLLDVSTTMAGRLYHGT